MIFDPDPAACIANVRNALGPLADKLRHSAASVEILDHGNRTVRTIVMAVTMGGPLEIAKEVSAGLQSLASKAGGVIVSNLLSPYPAGEPDGDYRFALAFSVNKRRAA